MTYVDVVWQSYKSGTPNRGYWDMAMLEALFAKELWSVPGDYTYRQWNNMHDLPQDSTGAIIIFPARYHRDLVHQFNAAVERLEWCIYIVAGDEEGVFPLQELKHPRMLIYLMTPHVEFGDRSSADRYLGEGFPPEAPVELAKHSGDKTLDWFFAGQVTHERREMCVERLENLPGGKLIKTEGFTKGIDQPDYYQMMASAKIVPCPSGPETPDTFRLYEALEAGCIPIADECTPGTGSKPLGYWNRLFSGNYPFPTITDWNFAASLIQNLKDRQEKSNQVYSWWQGYKRDLCWNMHEDVRKLSRLEEDLETEDISELITVLIPTSSIDTHPDTALLEETLASVKERLPKAEFLILVDGLRPELHHRKASYDEYVRRILWKANFHWENVWPIVFEDHSHQAKMTREALKKVKTPCVFFVEHDAPICEDIDFDGVVKIIRRGDLDVVRLLHEAYILEPYKHMMLDAEPQDFSGVPIVRTAQWSQRPHVALTDFYRRILNDHFSEHCNIMIEDQMHGVAWNAYQQRAKAGWNDYRIGIYAPAGDMKRSLHSDGRGADSKYEETFVS